MQIEITQKEIKFAEQCALEWCIGEGAYCDDEIKSAAREGLGMAAVFFDPAISPHFNSFAKIHINKAIVQYYRDNFGRSVKKVQFVQFDENQFSKNGLSDRIIAKDGFYKFCLMSGGREFYSLSKKAIRRIRMKYLEGYTQREIAQMENITQENISLFFKRVRMRANRFKNFFDYR